MFVSTRQKHRVGAGGTAGLALGSALAPKAALPPAPQLCPAQLLVTPIQVCILAPLLLSPNPPAHQSVGASSCQHKHLWGQPCSPPLAFPSQPLWSTSLGEGTAPTLLSRAPSRASLQAPLGQKGWQRAGLGVSVICRKSFRGCSPQDHNPGGPSGPGPTGQAHPAPSCSMLQTDPAALSSLRMPVSVCLLQ